MITIRTLGVFPLPPTQTEQQCRQFNRLGTSWMPSLCDCSIKYAASRGGGKIRCAPATCLADSYSQRNSVWSLAGAGRSVYGTIVLRIFPRSKTQPFIQQLHFRNFGDQLQPIACRELSHQMVPLVAHGRTGSAGAFGNLLVAQTCNNSRSRGVIRFAQSEHSNLQIGRSAV